MHHGPEVGVQTPPCCLLLDPLQPLKVCAGPWPRGVGGRMRLCCLLVDPLQPLEVRAGTLLAGGAAHVAGGEPRVGQRYLPQRVLTRAQCSGVKSACALDCASSLCPAG